jgi:cytochrome bd ubiquinol oxidase subunit II
VGVVSLAMLIMHGAVYATLKVGEPIGSRAAAAGRAAVLVYVVTFVASGVWLAVGVQGQTVVVAGTSELAPLHQHVTLMRGGWLAHYREEPLLWLAPALALLGAAAAWTLLGARRAGAAFVGSSVCLAGTILTAGIALYPFFMPSSTHPDQGLTVWNASSSQRTLFIMLLAVIVLLPVVLAYTAWVYRVLTGRITLEEIRRHTGLY